MRRDEALAIIDRHRSELSRRGVAELCLFGSVARDEADENSDVDVFVVFSGPVGLFELVGLKLWLEEIMGCPVDLIEKGSIKPALRERILAEAIRAA